MPRLRAVGLGQAVQAALQVHVLAPGQEVVQRGVLQRRADVPAHLGALGRDVEARDRGAARGGRQQRREHVDGGGLSGPVGPEEAVDLARGDLEVDAVDGVDVALECPDEAFDDDAAMVGAHVSQRFRSFEVVNDLCR